MQKNIDFESSCMSLLEQYNFIELISSTKVDGWKPVWAKLEDMLESHKFEHAWEKSVFLDLFFSYCLINVNIGTLYDLWEVSEKWFQLRKPPDRTSAMTNSEQAAEVYIGLQLRQQIFNWLISHDLEKLSLLNDHFPNLLISLWQHIFLNMFSPINMFSDSTVAEIPPIFPTSNYMYLLALSLYYPLDAEKFDLACDAFLASSLPLQCKNIFIGWILNIPYFNGTMTHRNRFCYYVPRLCSALLKRTDLLTLPYFVSLVQELMANFWRASYIGGNNIEALSAFGDFITQSMKRFCPNIYTPVKRTIPKGEKMRIGYISRNFFRQAVSYYMINRVIYHDRSNFEVFIYAIGETKDAFTEIYESNCDKFTRLPDFNDMGKVINTILNDRLDMLIFTDIGMDAMTYILGGLRLAPIQCALVGHGTSTGLPYIDYYISGDHESIHAQSQYREKLICLKNLGAAQYLPEEPIDICIRKELGIPDDAVLFISCANGIKHRIEREALYIEILKQASNAYILLKPYTSPDGIDARLAKRAKSLAMAAGVEERLLIIPSLGHYRTVLGLLHIADVQLDTYPYGGWTTNLEALYCGLPIVTQEGELSRSRWGAGMLRALGIEHGIATSDEEFVSAAVRFATDSTLRQEVSSLIKSRVCDTLFNGEAAQSHYEATLLDIFENHIHTRTSNKLDCTLLKKLDKVSIILPQHIYIATSISPNNFDHQRAALTSWQEAGYKILALNAPDELSNLCANFPNIEFLAAQNTATSLFGKPYIFFNDLLTCLKEKNCKVGGVINSDIYLINNQLYDLTAKQSDNSIIFGSRFDVSDINAREGKVYDLGFDYFFFGSQLFNAFPKDAFCLGLPWWDYWAVSYPFSQKVQIKRVATPAGLHVLHPTNWSKSVWLRLGENLAKYVPSPIPLNDDSMLNYLHYVVQKIASQRVDIII